MFWTKHPCVSEEEKDLLSFSKQRSPITAYRRVCPFLKKVLLVIFLNSPHSLYPAFLFFKYVSKFRKYFSVSNFTSWNQGQNFKGNPLRVCWSKTKTCLNVHSGKHFNVQQTINTVLWIFKRTWNNLDRSYE